MWSHTTSHVSPTVYQATSKGRGLKQQWLIPARASGSCLGPAGLLLAVASIVVVRWCPGLELEPDKGWTQLEILVPSSRNEWAAKAGQLGPSTGKRLLLASPGHFFFSHHAG